MAWNRNVVTMGLASGFVEPLESTSIHMVQSGIAKLIALFPDKRFNPVERDEYNRQMGGLFEDVRDFIVLHYKATARDDSEFWNRCRTAAIPDSLAAKMELWRAKGRIFRENLELFGTTSWVAVMLGQNIVPDEYEPAADALDPDRVAEALEQMRVAYADTARRLPSHGEFIAHACATQPAAAAPPALPEFTF
jgi:tryptophan halogenase